MGSSSKKKKSKSGGSGRRRNKGRVPSKDHISFDDEDNEIIREEITVLTSIFQEDLNIVSESPPYITVKIRPYTKDMCYEDPDISALLLVRYFPGYPYNCPKLQITPEKGVSENDAQNLLSLLRDQAISNAREGMVMIYNLVEAAKEFLSEIVPDERVDADSNGRLGQNDTAAFSKKATSPRGPFVYGFIDLFSGSGESLHWGIGIDDRGININASRKEYKNQEKKDDKTVIPKTSPDKQQSSSVGLHTVEECGGDGRKGKDVTYTRCSTSDKSTAGQSEGERERLAGDSDGDSLYSLSESLSASLTIHDSSQTTQKDLLMVHLLHLACASSRPLADALPQISTELYNLGIFSDLVRDLASKPYPHFHKIFEQAFQQNMVSSKITQFWQATSNLSASVPGSRYLNDFEELKSLGHGGFGHVVLCKNKLDGRKYAVKKILLKDKHLPINDRILREVATLSRLQHQHVVRYYQAWFETGVPSLSDESPWGSRTATSSLLSFKGATSADDVLGQDNKLESTYLYIQMEYCPRTLRQDFESYHFDQESAWHLFRQIVEGLAHIHGQGIIHRDLTPSNIFFDARNEIKIGDFGLAKFLKLEQLDQDASFPMDTTGISVEGTGQVGTYFYTAPEIEQGWPKIDEKADMYSLGVVFFELWHPFGTAMERHIVLSDLKQKGDFPSSWITEFPEQASLLQKLLSPSPSERPSATELLQHSFPPRMEFELIDNILGTMHSSDDSTVYDKVVNCIFGEKMMSIKTHHSGVGASSIQYTDVNTELRDNVADVAKEVFKRHCAKHLEILPMHLLNNSKQLNRNTVKLLTSGGDMIEVCHELRLPFVNWAVANQKILFKRYEISHVYRKAIGHSPPNRYLQGDFDIIGGAPALTEAEVIKAVVDIIKHIFNSDICDIHLNHGELLDAIWSWIGIEADHRHKVAELLSMMSSLRPLSAERKSKWVVIRRQLLQELNLAEAVVNKLQTVGLRFCGPAELALPRLRGALPANKHTRKALDDLSEIYSYLRVWRLEKHVYIDALMPPTEIYHRDLYFQIYSTKEHNPGSLSECALLAVGGRYDYLLHQMCDHESKTCLSGAVGTSLALETIIQLSSTDFKPIRTEATSHILVCSRGGGGLLEHRMELVSELWEVNIKAEFVPLADPSFAEQYEYANEHDIKCLVILTDTASHTGFVKVRHLELKKEKEVSRLEIVRFLQDAVATQFKILSIWI